MKQIKVYIIKVIGSDKTTFCNRFNKVYDFPNSYSDIPFKSLYNDSNVQDEVLELIG